jgi:hypothetical protein
MIWSSPQYRGKVFIYPWDQMQSSPVRTRVPDDYVVNGSCTKSRTATIPIMPSRFSGQVSFLVWRTVFSCPWERLLSSSLGTSVLVDYIVFGSCTVSRTASLFISVNFNSGLKFEFLLNFQQYHFIFVLFLTLRNIYFRRISK